MIILADSGGTKTDWLMVDALGARQSLQTTGLSPTHKSLTDIAHVLERELPHRWRNADEVHFYGAGLGNPDPRNQIREVLNVQFPKAVVHVEADILAAARSTCGREAGICGILGTGSIACLYDGEKIVSVSGGHGWILGDEGSGIDLGKHLLKAALEGKWPEALVRSLEQFAGMGLLEMRRQVYQPGAGSFLSNLARFAHENRHAAPVKTVIDQRFEAFAASFPADWDRSLPLWFVGGIADRFQDNLTAIFGAKDFSKPQFRFAPMDGLLAYHLGQPKP